MKFKKSLAFVRCTLALCFVVPMGAMAAKSSSTGSTASSSSKTSSGFGLGGLNKIGNSVANAALRQTIKTLSGSINADKKAISTDMAAIAKDLAGVKSDPTVTGSDDYKTVMSNLSSIKTDLTSANAINYKDALGTVKGNNATNAEATLNSVISLMQQKLGVLDQAKALAESTITISDKVSAQKQADKTADQQFLSDAAGLKVTIENNHSTISSDADTVRNTINTIVANFSTNKDLLMKDPAALQSIVTILNNVKSELTAEYNGKMIEDTKQYDTDRKNKDYTKAITDLNTIVTAQNNRINILTTAQGEVNSALEQLNNLVAAGGLSSTSSTSSAASVA